MADTTDTDTDNASIKQPQDNNTAKQKIEKEVKTNVSKNINNADGNCNGIMQLEISPEQLSWVLALASLPSSSK